MFRECSKNLWIALYFIVAYCIINSLEMPYFRAFVVLFGLYYRGLNNRMVVRGRIELPTRRFSVCCSTD